MHDRAIDFIRKNQAKPFFLCNSMVHVHGDIQPTPDGAPDSKDLFKYAAGAAGGLAQIKLQNVKSLTEVLTNEQMHQII